MIAFKTPPPRTITLITTLRCNATCRDCCFGCRPDRGRTMTLDEMRCYVDICLEAYPESINNLSLTGGECFLLGADLDEIVKCGKERGLSVDFVSNGYWGKSYKSAYERLSQLKTNGLSGMSFSIGGDHNHIIPLRNCRNAVVAAARLGYKVELRLEHDWRQKTNLIDTLRKDDAFMRLVNTQRIKIISWQWQPYNNELKHGRGNAWRHRPYGESKPCKLLFNTIVITPYGDVLACCGIGNSRNPHMRLGNIRKEPIKTIYSRCAADLVKIWIKTEGADAVLQYVYDKSDIKFHNCGDGCQSCIEIFENPRILPFLRSHYDDWCCKFYSSYIW